MAAAEIQLDLFAIPPAGDSRVMQLMRPHKWAHGSLGELPLVSIEVQPVGERWVWAACLNSRNGAGQGGQALPKWGKFASSRLDAILRAVDEVRDFMHRAAPDEQARITEWLSSVLSAAAHNR